MVSEHTNDFVTISRAYVCIFVNERLTRSEIQQTLSSHLNKKFDRCRPKLMKCNFEEVGFFDTVKGDPYELKRLNLHYYHIAKNISSFPLKFSTKLCFSILLISHKDPKKNITTNGQWQPNSKYSGVSSVIRVQKSFLTPIPQYYL